MGRPGRRGAREPERTGVRFQGRLPAIPQPGLCPLFCILEGRLLAMFQSLSAQKLDVQHKSPVERVIFSMLRRYKQ